jgi:hypothetical protein
MIGLFLDYNLSGSFQHPLFVQFTAIVLINRQRQAGNRQANEKQKTPECRQNSFGYFAARAGIGRLNENKSNYQKYQADGQKSVHIHNAPVETPAQIESKKHTIGILL